MDNFVFGLAMTLGGMGGTLLSLWVLILFMILLKKVFPIKSVKGDQRQSRTYIRRNL